MKRTWLACGIVSAGLAIVLGFLFGSSHASALGLPVPVEPGVYGSNMDGSGREILTAVSACFSNNCQKSKNTVTLVYVPVGISSFNITLDHGCFVKGVDNALFYNGNYEENSSSTYTQFYMYYGQSLGGDPQVIVPNLSGPDLLGVTTKQPGVCNPGSGPNITRTINFVQASAPQIDIKGASYHVLVFRGRANTTFYYYNQFRILADNGAVPGNGVLLGMSNQTINFDGVLPPAGEETSTTVASTDTFGSQNWQFYTEFAPPCQADGSNKAYFARFTVYDADIGVYQSPGELRFKIIELDKATGNPTGRVVRDEALVGGNGATENFDDTYNANYKYQILIYGIAPVNSQQFKLPFDQIYAKEGQCSVPPSNVSGCYLIDPGNGGGPVVNGSTITAFEGQNLTMTFAWQNTAAAGSTTWTNVGKNINGAYDAGWDSGIPPPLDSHSQYDGTVRANLIPKVPSPDVAPGGIATFYWQPGAFNQLGTFQEKFRMVHEGDAWFGSDCTLTIKILSPQPVVDCDLSPSSDFAEVGTTMTGLMNIRYTVPDPTYYQNVTITSTTFSVTNPSGVSLGSGPGTNGMVLTPNSTASVTFSKVFSLAAAGTYTLTGLFSGTSPDGIGGTLSFSNIQCTGTKPVGNVPYLRVYGGEVKAGVSFGSACSAVNSSITASARQDGSGNWIGAGSQFGSYANVKITNFATAILLAPAAPSTLAFANTPASLTAYPDTGGGFGSVFCTNDYWPAVLPALTGGAANTIDASTSGAYQFPGGSQLSQTAPLTSSTTIYVNGDLTILTDLTTTNSWASPANIPSLYIIAKGNIYIKPSVHQLDGVFVAQPTAIAPAVTKGRIYTCFNNTVATTTSVWLATNCRNNLTINGAFLAAKVNFYRAKGTLSAGVVSEAAGNANIAETFQFTPELLLSTPILPATSSGNGVNSIIGLPPSL